MKILKNTFMDELNGDGNDLGGVMTEEQALSDLSSMGNETETTQEPQATETTQEGQESITGNNEVQTQDIDLSDVDLSFLGIESQTVAQPGEITEDPQPAEGNPEGQVNQLDEIKDMITGLSGNNQTSQEQPQLTPEQMAGAKEIFNLLQNAGLLPKEFGLSQEQQDLLNNVNKISEKLQEQEQEEQAFQEHQTKLSALQSYDAQLAKHIKGYDSEFMQKVVADINQKNPEAAMKIFNDPTKLLELWEQVGAKAQPQETQSNVIASTGQETSKISSLEEKVMNGTASEQEEAEWLAGA